MKLASLLIALAIALPANAKVKLVTSLPDLAWAAQEIGKDQVEVKALLKGTEDPHYADAVPEFIRLVSNADIVCQVGMDLEVGWLPKVLARSGNSKVQAGGKGYCELGKGIDALEKPTGPVDRSMGDVHPAGNPHFWLSPKMLAKGASQILEALVRVDPDHAATYKKNYDELVKRMDQFVEKNKAKLAGFAASSAVFEYHKEFAYFFDVYGLKSLGSIEEKPGVPPSAGRMAEVASQAKSGKAKAILATDYNPRRTVERVSELAGIPAVIVPSSVQPNGAIKDYLQLQDHIVESLAKLGGK